MSGRWLVVDNNELAALANVSNADLKRRGFHGISWSSHVLAEMLLNPKHTRSRGVQLSKFRMRFGLELPDVFERLAASTAADVRTFDPFLRGETTPAHLSETVLKQALVNPAPAHFDWAMRSKARNLAFCAGMKQPSESLRARLRSTGSSPKFLEPAAEVRRWLRDGTLDWWIVQTVTWGGRRRLLHLTEAQLCEAGLANPRLRRFWCALLFYLVSVSGWWQSGGPEQRNVDPADGKDYRTDFALPLFASDGDAIVTRDKWLRFLVRSIQPDGAIWTTSVADLLVNSSPRVSPMVDSNAA